MARPWFMDQFNEMGYAEANEIFRLLGRPENRNAQIAASRCAYSREELVVTAKRLFNIKIEKDPTKDEEEEKRKWYANINNVHKRMRGIDCEDT